MPINISFSYIFTFLLLLVVTLELHETTHIVVGRLLCGCWGPRDFNVWSLCSACADRNPYWWLATLAGPLVSFALMWLGWFWLGSARPDAVAAGFSLIFANIPFGRLSTVMLGGGDELVVLRTLLGNDVSRSQRVVICSILVFGVVAPPVVKAFRVLTDKWAWLYITGFLTLPLLFLLLYVLTGLNGLIRHGFLATPWIMGTPLLITLHTAVTLIGLLWLRKNLFSLTKTGPAPA